MATLEAELAIDVRDVMVAFAGYVDCARRLDIDPVEVFATAATGRSAAMIELASGFASRSDITLEAFGWRLEDRPQGPCYRPGPAPSRHQLRRDNRGDA